MRKNIVFIVGPPRTGTTYLLLLLDEHKKLNNRFGTPYESSLFNRGKISSAKPRLLQFREKEHILYKDPNSAKIAKDILSNFGNSLMIYLVRDPFDMITSYFHTPKGQGLSVINDMRNVMSLYNDMAVGILKVANDERVMFIKSEDLFNNTDKVLKNIYPRIPLKVDNLFIKKSVDKHKFGKNIIPEKREMVYRVGHYSAENFLLNEQKKQIKESCWSYYQELLSKCI